MDLSCHRCSKSSSTPSAFLLTCGSCKRAWHHRCHIPPIEDDELLQRIHFNNAGDYDNGLAGWRCKRCKKNQAAETSSRTATQPLRPRQDDSQQLPSAQAHGLALRKDKREVDANIATHSTGKASSIEATAQVFHDVKPGTQLNDHGSRYQQQQGSHTNSQMGNLDNDLLPTTAVKRLQTKRVLQEQHRDRPRADHPHDLELCLDQPAAPPKYARAPDGKKVVSPGHPSRVEQPKTMNRVPPSHMEKYEAGKEDTPPVASRCVTLVSERAIRSSSTSWPDKEEELVRCDPVVKTSSESNGQEVGTRTDTPPEPPVEHGDIHMKNLDDDNSPTPILSSSKTFSEQQGGSVSEEGRQTIQRQELNKDILGDVGGVSHSHHESESRRSTVKRTPKVEAEAPLGPNWVKARHPVADDPWRCLCDRQPQMYGDNRRKKPNAKFLGDVVHSMATPDRALLKFLFFRDWIQLTQANI